MGDTSEERKTWSQPYARALRDFRTAKEGDRDTFRGKTLEFHLKDSSAMSARWRRHEAVGLSPLICTDWLPAWSRVYITADWMILLSGSDWSAETRKQFQQGRMPLLP